MKRSGDDDDQFVVFHEDGKVVESGSRFTKILRRCSSPPSTSHRHLEVEEEKEDRISKLPDHILVSILNLMMTNALGKKGEIEQVVRTSVLARRWRYLWNYSLKSLIFTFTERDSRYFYDENYSVHKAGHRRFVDRVNLILALPVVGDATDDFNLSFWLADRQTYWSVHLPGWIGFALQKRVKRLTIKLQHFDYRSVIGDFKNSFTLDNKLIRNHNMDSLVSFCLSKVDAAGQFLEHLLITCGSLEHLSISYSITLVDFTISGPCLKLKYLQIHYCQSLQRLHICHVNLVSLDYNPGLYSNNTAVVIEDAPRLFKTRLNFFSGKDKTVKVLSYLPRLQTLAFAYTGTWFLGPDPELAKLTNLVKVQLDLKSQVFVSTICASLLVSLPSIRELILKGNL